MIKLSILILIGILIKSYVLLGWRAKTKYSLMVPYVLCAPCSFLFCYYFKSVHFSYFVKMVPYVLHLTRFVTWVQRTLNLKEHVYLVRTTFTTQLEVSCVIVCGLSILFYLFIYLFICTKPPNPMAHATACRVFFFFLRRTCIRAWSSIFALKNELIRSSTAASRK